MKKKFKYFIFFFIVILSSFVLSKRNKTAAKIAKVKIETKDSTTIKKAKPFLIGKYSEAKSKKINRKLDSLLKRINKRHDFHGSVVVVKNGKLVYLNQVGTADFRKKKALKKESVYQLASVSKQFTAAAIMILYERNQLKLTDTINKFFPDFPFKNITITQLLNHTSGLPKYFWIAEHEWNKKTPPTNAEMMKFIETSSTVSNFFRPGRRFDYSNTGYFVLASIIEKISGKSYASFLKENIFEPLQMNDSFVYSYTYDPIRDNQLAGYRLYRRWRHLKIPGTINDAIVGDKNIYATNEDMLKWAVGFSSGKIVSKKSLEMMFTKGKTKYGRKIPYGFGFRIDTKNDEKLVYHFGKWNGFSTGLTIYPDDLIVIILEHTSYKSMGYLNRKIRNMVLNNLQ